VDRIPGYLLSTYRLVQCTFPSGIHEDEYFPLLSILHMNMSDRALAELITYLGNKTQPEALHDVYVAATVSHDDLVIIEIMGRLESCGYEDWVTRT
jgi:hypothetical protein